MKLVYHAVLGEGSTSLQRLAAFGALPDLEVIAHDTMARMGVDATFYRRVRWKLGWPTDDYRENQRLIDCVATHQADIVFVDNSKVISSATLRRLRKQGVSKLVYYSPDDTMNRYNLKWPLRLSIPLWDVFFTTKTFNIDELRAHGARNPYLIGKAFDAQLHRPLSREEVGRDFEKFDFVFAGAWERERMTSLNALCEAGFSVVCYGGSLGNWNKKEIHPGIVGRPAAFGEAYTHAMHHGKIALGFLRKINRDKITQRSMEVTAMGRAMLAEKTDEHDSHFIDGEEYCGFLSDSEMVAKGAALLADDAARLEMGRRARERCLTSGYSSIDRAREMLAVICG